MVIAAAHTSAASSGACSLLAAKPRKIVRGRDGGFVRLSVGRYRYGYLGYERTNTTRISRTAVRFTVTTLQNSRRPAQRYYYYWLRAWSLGAGTHTHTHTQCTAPASEDGCARAAFSRAPPRPRAAARHLARPCHPSVQRTAPRPAGRPTPTKNYGRRRCRSARASPAVGGVWPTPIGTRPGQ